MPTRTRSRQDHQPDDAPLKPEVTTFSEPMTFPDGPGASPFEPEPEPEVEAPGPKAKAKAKDEEEPGEEERESLPLGSYEKIIPSGGRLIIHDGIMQVRNGN
jgi:hypothetical protein